MIDSISGIQNPVISLARIADTFLQLPDTRHRKANSNG